MTEDGQDSGRPQMEASEQIQKYAEFIEKNYLAALLENVRNGHQFLQIDFIELTKFDPDLADLTLDNPDDLLKAASLAIQQFDLPKHMSSFELRLLNLPEVQRILIRNIRSKNLDKLHSFKGTVRQKSDVRPQTTAARFECPSCGNIMNVLQLDKKFKEPNRCSCGRKGKFRMLSKELVDAQGLVLEEDPEDLSGSEQPKRINVLLKNDLVSPISEKKTSPGSKLIVTGQIKEVPIILREGGQSTRFDLIIEANSIETLEEDFTDIKITEEDKKEIIALSQNPEHNKILMESVAPTIFGHDRIKDALILQLFGGVQKNREDGGFTRGDIHLLLIGDPGCGKSQLLKRIINLAPKGRFVSGKGVSGTGLTASVVKDEFLSGWSLEAGAFVLANKGIIGIDELDKVGHEDRAAMHEAMEGQTITIAKANVQATLKCQTSVLGAANPKFGRFDPYETPASQIDLPSTLINRFDLIFPVKDLPDEEKDGRMARFVLTLHKGAMAKEPPISTEMLRKYIAYARQNCAPELTDAAIEEIEQYYVKMRSMGKEGSTKSIPISARQLEGLVRMTEACAKTRLATNASKKDAQYAIELLDHCLKQVAFDNESGTFDIDRIATDVTASQRSKIGVIKEVINELEKEFGKSIPLDEILEKTKEKGYEDSEVEEVMSKLKRSGDVFEPRRGFISKL